MKEVFSKLLEMAFVGWLIGTAWVLFCIGLGFCGWIIQTIWELVYGK